MFVVVNVVSGGSEGKEGDICLNTAEIVSVWCRDEHTGASRVVLRDGSVLDVSNRWEDLHVDLTPLSACGLCGETVYGLCAECKRDIADPEGAEERAALLQASARPRLHAEDAAEPPPE